MSNMYWVGGFFILHPTFFLLQIISQMQFSFLIDHSSLSSILVLVLTSDRNCSLPYSENKLDRIYCLNFIINEMKGIYMTLKYL